MTISLAPAVNPDATLAPATGAVVIPLPPAGWPGPLDDSNVDTLLCVRVSTKPQSRDGRSMESQEIELRHLCGLVGLRPVEVLPYVGTATLRRAKYWRQIEAGLLAGRYQRVLFHNIARLSRRGDFDGKTRLNQIEEAGGAWYILTAPELYATDNKLTRDLLLSIYFSQAAGFIDTLRTGVMSGQRTRLGIGTDSPGKPVSVARVAQGLRWSEADGCYWVEEGRAAWGTIEAAFATILRVRTLCGAVTALTQAGYRTRAGREFSPTTLGYIIRNPIYKGEAHGRRHEHFYHSEKGSEAETRRKRQRPVEERTILLGIVKRDPALGNLIAEADWEAAQGCIGAGNARRQKAPDAESHLLAGHLVCDECDRACWAGTGSMAGNRGAPVYRCGNARRGLTKTCAGCGCASATALDREVWADLMARLALPGVVRRAWEARRSERAPLEGEIEAARETVAQLRAEWDHRVDVYSEHKTTDPAYARLKAKAEAAWERVLAGERDLKTLTSRRAEAPMTEERLARFEAFVVRLVAQRAVTPADQRRVLATLDVAVALKRAERGVARRWEWRRLDLPDTAGTVQSAASAFQSSPLDSAPFSLLAAD